MGDSLKSYTCYMYIFVLVWIWWCQRKWNLKKMKISLVFIYRCSRICVCVEFCMFPDSHNISETLFSSNWQGTALNLSRVHELVMWYFEPSLYSKSITNVLSAHWIVYRDCSPGPCSKRAAYAHASKYVLPVFSLQWSWLQPSQSMTCWLWNL